MRWNVPKASTTAPKVQHSPSAPTTPEGQHWPVRDTTAVDGPPHCPHAFRADPEGQQSPWASRVPPVRHRRGAHPPTPQPEHASQLRGPSHPLQVVLGQLETAATLTERCALGQPTSGAATVVSIQDGAGTAALASDANGSRTVLGTLTVLAGPPGRARARGCCVAAGAHLLLRR